MSFLSVSVSRSNLAFRSWKK